MKQEYPFPSSLLAPKYWLTWLAIGLFVPIAWLPHRGRRFLGKMIGSWLYKHNHKRRNIISTNIALSFPQLTEEQQQQMSKKTLINYAHAMLDYSLLFFRSRSWLYSQLNIIGKEYVDKEVAAGRNVIFLLGHSIWLEMAPVFIGHHYQAYGSYKPFSNAVFDWLVATSRLKDAQFLITREEGLLKMARSLKPGLLMVILPDEDHGLVQSVFAPFYGTQKSTLTSPARLSKMGKAAAIPIMAFYNETTNQYDVVIKPPLANYGTKDEIADAALLNQGMEDLINYSPNQYMWMMKLFKTRPENESSVY